MMDQKPKEKRMRKGCLVLVFVIIALLIVITTLIVTTNLVRDGIDFIQGLLA